MPIQSLVPLNPTKTLDPVPLPAQSPLPVSAEAPGSRLWLCPAGKSMSSPSGAPLRHTPESLGGGSRIRVQAVVGREGLDLLGLTHPAAALVVVLQAQSLACCLPVLVCTTLCSPQIEVEAAQRRH